MTQPRITPSQRASRKLKENCTFVHLSLAHVCKLTSRYRHLASFDFDIEEGSLRVEMSMSQKLPVSTFSVSCHETPLMEISQTALRTETLKAIVKAMHNCLTENVWERLFAAKGDFTAKQRCVNHPQPSIYVKLRSWYTTHSGPQRS